MSGSSGPEITRVTGGSAPIRLPYDDVRTMAARIERAGGDADARARSLGSVAVSPHLLASAPFSPTTATAAEAAVTSLAGTLVGWAHLARKDASSARLAADLLAAADSTAHTTLSALETVVARSWGDESAPPVVRRTDLHVPLSTTAPSDLESLLAHQQEVTDLSPTDHSAGNGTIEVQTVVGADGRRRHILYLPGLDDRFDPTQDRDVRDLGAVADLLVGDPTAYAAGAIQALHQAGVAPDEPVLVVGHSQGGMTAMWLASHETGFDITQVVTAGAPVVPGDPGPGTHVLSLEHQGDPLILVDAGASSDSPHHTTVTFEDGIDLDPFANHDLDHYRDGAHAVDQSSDPVVQQAAAGVDPFLAQPGDQATGTVFQITRHDEQP